MSSTIQAWTSVPGNAAIVPLLTAGPQDRPLRQAGVNVNRSTDLILIVNVVYEAHEIRAAGGKIIVRPDFEGPTGMMTDEAEASIVAEIELVHDGNVSDLLKKTNFSTRRRTFARPLSPPAPHTKRAA